MRAMGLILLSVAPLALAQTPAVPDWAIPGSATHKQVPPPPDFHREAVTTMTPLGVFDGQSDVGAAVVPGSSTFADGKYTITATGKDVANNNVGIAAQVQGVVSSVDLTQSPPLLTIDGASYTLSQVKSIIATSSN